ncbi:MAG: hypothetical protein KJ831_14820 [Candidatus Eisenbacteria bacterium]|nr:hypothetical protein [Candidatus Eisenbacteria bacterium]
MLFVDHWEPNLNGNPDRVQFWVDNYRPFADRHRDSDGRPLRHTWFQRNGALGNPGAHRTKGSCGLCWNYVLMGSAKSTCMSITVNRDHRKRMY